MGIKNRNIVVAILLSIVTCGIYGIIWVIGAVKDAQKVTGEADIVVLLLCLFLPFIGFYMLEKKFTDACAAKGIEHKDNSVVYLILGLVVYIGFIIGPTISLIMLQNDLNKLADTDAE